MGKFEYIMALQRYTFIWMIAQRVMLLILFLSQNRHENGSSDYDNIFITTSFCVPQMCLLIRDECNSTEGRKNSDIKPDGHC
jgi:hypothetical protein